MAAYREGNDNLEYVVLAGGDDAIPFFRYPDPAYLGPESDYIPPVEKDSASEASLRSNYVLGQDEYGASTVLELGPSPGPGPRPRRRPPRRDGLRHHRHGRRVLP